MIKKNERLMSLDVFRGGVLAGFILQSNPGTRAHIYSQLHHAEWNGFTIADLGFPIFLFIVGVAMSFSLFKLLEKKVSKFDIYKKVVVRTLALFILGLLIENLYLILSLGYSLTDVLSYFRVMGILQRISVTYFLASVILIEFRSFKAIFLWTVGILAGYWFLMMTVPVPGYGAGNLSKTGNLATYIDNLVMGNHLWMQGNFEPEGLLSTVSATSTVLIGSLTGQLLRLEWPKLRKVRYLLISGAGILVLGLIADRWFPINKSLWTSSYTLLTGGISIIIMSALYWIIEIKKISAWARSFQLFGIYCLPIFLAVIAVTMLINEVRIPVPDGGSAQLNLIFYYHLFLPLTGRAELASFLWSVLYLAFWVFLVHYFSNKEVLHKFSFRRYLKRG